MKRFSTRRRAALVTVILIAAVLAGRLADMTLVRPLRYRERIGTALREAQQ